MKQLKRGISRRAVMGLSAAAIAAAVLPVEAATVIERVEQPTKHLLTIDVVIECICINFRLDRDFLLSPDRSRYVVRARQYGMYLAKTLTPRSLPEIGRRFGGRDHTTVLHAFRKIESLRKEDEAVDEDLSFLADCLRHMVAIKNGEYSVLETPQTVGRSYGG